MDTYAYKGISDGKYVEGDIEALNQDEASHKLKEQKIIITNLVRAVKGKKKEDKETKKKKGSSLFGKKKAKVEDVLIFSKQFATMVKAGLPILQVLGMLRDQLESPAMKDVVEDIRKSLEGGVTLSKCFEKFPELFDNVYINLIKAGEASGKLDVFLLKIVESLEKKEAIKKKIKGALMYPSIMFTVAITVSAFMLIKVVPVFAKMYDGMGIELPAATATIMGMSDFLRGTGGKILFLTDADVDGAHIRTLLLTFFFKFMPGLIKEGKVWIAEPPLYRAKSSGSINYLKDDKSLEEFKKENKNKKFDISRFKGLGEMNAGELWDTAMNPGTRSLIKVSIADGKAAEAKAANMFEVLMGNDVAKRKTFIEQNAKDVRFLDV